MAQVAEFRFAMPTRILFGVGRVRQVGKECAALGAQRALVVTDEGIAGAGLLGPIKESLERADIGVSTYEKVQSNPTTTNSDEAAAIAKEDGCDVVVAVGGGSSIDAAKGAAVVAVLGGECADYLGGAELPPCEPLPIVAIPTTAGTGSEVTRWAVINIEEEEHKSWIGSTRILPAVALLDPEMTYTLPPGLTAYTGLDALTHAVGAYTSTYHNPIADALAMAAVHLVGKSLIQAVEHPRDEEARGDMLVASTMAGAAFESAKLVATHCLSEALGGPYHLHHGLLNGILLPYVMEYNQPVVAERQAEIGRALGHEKEDGVEAVRHLVEVLDLPKLGDLGVREFDLPRVAGMAARNCSDGRNPRPLSEDDLLGLLRAAM